MSTDVNNGSMSESVPDALLPAVDQPQVAVKSRVQEQKEFTVETLCVLLGLQPKAIKEHIKKIRGLTATQENISGRFFTLAELRQSRFFAERLNEQGERTGVGKYLVDRETGEAMVEGVCCVSLKTIIDKTYAYPYTIGQRTKIIRKIESKLTPVAKARKGKSDIDVYNTSDVLSELESKEVKDLLASFKVVSSRDAGSGVKASRLDELRSILASGKPLFPDTEPPEEDDNKRKY